MKKVVYFVMAGGEGMRLWPMSRSHFPKQLHSLLGDSSLLQQSIERLRAIGAPQDILIGTRTDLYFSIKEQWENMGIGCPPWLILEPLSRNTAPAIALAVCACRQRYGEDVIIVTLAADHVIKQPARFRQLVAKGVNIAAKGTIVTFGIIPAYPETGYGYIKVGEKIEEDVFRVGQFKEKPGAETAVKYVQSRDYLWNSGMFIFDTKVMADNLKRFCPKVWDTAVKVWKKRKEKPDNVSFDQKPFSMFPNVSIDYAVMEKVSNGAVIKADFGWCDVGCWRMVYEVSPKDKDGNVFSGDVYSLDTRNTFVKSDRRFVAAVGLKDLIVIDTPDALLISDRGRSQDVKNVVNRLNARQSHLTKFHTTVYRPWGNYTVLEEGPGYKIKRVVVKAKGQLSLQKHNFRSEHWVVVSGKAQVVSGKKKCLLKQNESVFIPKGHKHRISNPFNKEVVIIEVQTGAKITEEDIVRFDDLYERC
ncbi:MAG: mannose-1-phosphate guanylyltransferase/mannose-6-phosphate isomerase [Candidatus Omnitrophica bacterium]|nr:mannose-1-phosphate guanylyltransferase/mannose-6-phosphate isomerase [Candidatus Omnitrophota bacterium]MBU4479670.1 mannose-1-phosphate guanylyltransferase/mannose-6-phosphate isomerase [Candidatus Omnitrophota bacterium]MCG2703650.1 mannose-1-phosphate guanylyltransferase/mannose-6-phosphate isomerase [Candidatus Omnitrophota bacterium]